MAATRIADEPAFVLHRHDWSESSLIIEAFTRHHGRVALVAKGAKRPSSNFRPVLLPLQPLRLGYAAASAEAEIHTLKSAEWAGGHVMPTGAALLSGYHLNELLLRLLARDDPHPGLHDHYAAVVQALATAQGQPLEPLLRAFELLLLREIGLLPALDLQTLTHQPVRPDAAYRLLPESGLGLAEGGHGGLAGADWLALQAALDQATPLAALARACAAAGAGLKRQLRALLHYHCGVPALRTRQLMIDLQSL